LEAGYFDKVRAFLGSNRKKFSQKQKTLPNSPTKTTNQPTSEPVHRIFIYTVSAAKSREFIAVEPRKDRPSLF